MFHGINRFLVHGSISILMKTVFRFFCISSLFIAYPGGIQGQDEDWKNQHDRGNRYEGLIGIQTGNPELEVVSFYAYKEPSYSDADIKVRFFLPSDAKSSHVSIVGREIAVIRQYWMESKPSHWSPNTWNEFSPWDTVILKRYQIPWDNLGIIVSISEKLGSSSRYLPAVVYQSSPPKSINRYTIYLRPNRDLSKQTYYLYATSSGRQLLAMKWSDEDEKTAGAPYPLEVNVSNLQEGPARLVIEREYIGSTAKPPPYEIRFYLKR